MYRLDDIEEKFNSMNVYYVRQVVPCTIDIIRKRLELGNNLLTRPW
jgi:hypothetical protein